MLQEAAALAQHCDGFWRDERDSARGAATVAYAIDVDVVVMYSDPQESRAYGAVFSQAGEVDTAVAAVLGEYILRRLKDGTNTSAGGNSTDGALGCLMIIPPHDAELRRVGMGIASAALKDVSADSLVPRLTETQRRDVRAKLAGLQHVSRCEAFFDYLSRENLLDEVMYGQSGAARQMARLNEVPTGRFTSLRQHAWFQGSGSAYLPPRSSTLLQPPADRRHMTAAESDAIRFTMMVDDWHSRILDHAGGIGQHKTGNLLDDAQVLARLEWINGRFAETPASGRRLVLITGTRRLFEAAQNVPASHPGFNSFAEAYLRHPQAFLGAKDVFEMTDEDMGAAHSDSWFDVSRIEFRVAEWLSVIFPHNLLQTRFAEERASVHGTTVNISFNPPGVHDLDRALEKLRNVDYRSEPGKTFPRDALLEWRDGMTSAHARLELQHKDRQQSAFTGELLALLADGSTQDAVEALTTFLHHRAQRSFGALFGLTDALGVEQLLAPDQMRGLPALRFDLPRFKAAQEQCDLLCRHLFDSRGKARSAEFNLAEMFNVLRQTDDSGYHARVLHAYLFASVGKWFQVRTLCLFALLVVDAIPDKAPDDQRTGREAAYLLAVAERRLAQRREGLVNARKALAEAWRRAKGDPRRDVRFDSEALAQAVTEHQLAFFREKRAVPKGLLESVNQAQEFAAAAVRNESGSVRRWVVRQCVTSGLLLCLMAHANRIQPAQVVGAARALLAQLGREKLAPQLPSEHPIPQKYADAISDFVWLVGTAVFGATAESQELARIRLRADLINAVSAASPLPIEEVRHPFLLEMAGIDMPVDPANGPAITRS